MARKNKQDEAVTLEILDAIDSQSDLSQRHLARRLGIALGLANSYLKRCVRKGLVKIQEAPANRYLYYLTPLGFAEKSRLTAEYLSSSFEYYNRAGSTVARALRAIEVDGHHRLLFAGVSELAEIASVRAHDFDVDICGTVDRSASVERFLGRPVWRRIDDAERFDAVLYTDISASRDNYDAVVTGATGRLYVPDMLLPTVRTFAP
ncbi:MAG: winged helix-turn-helix transcriptional regulator [Gammaproteobacteria bacterium]